MADPRPHRPGPLSRRRLLLVFALIFTGLLLAAWGWLWHSSAGLRFVLARAPLQWQSAQGSLAGGARIDGIAWQAEGASARVASLRFTVRPAALWRGELRLDRLDLDAVDLHLRRTGKGTAAHAGGTFPLALRIDVLHVTRLHLDGEGRRFDLDRVSAGVRLTGSQLRWRALRIALPGWVLQGDGSYMLDGSDALHLDAEARADHADWRVQGRLRYSRDDASLRIDGQAPQPLHVQANAQRHAGGWQWQAALRAQGLDTRVFGLDGDPLRFDLRASGSDLDAAVEGWVVRAGLQVDVQPSRIGWRDQALHLDPLSVRVGDSALQASGTLAFPVENVRADLAWDVHGALPGLAADARIAAQGRLDGDVANWRLHGAGELRLPAAPSLRVDLDGEGDRNSARLRQLRLLSAQGGARLAGEVTWAPKWAVRLHGDLDRLDPRLWSPAWPGRVSAAIDAQANREGEVWHYDARLSQLRGSLRGRPLRGELRVRQNADGGHLRAALGIGASRVQATAERRRGAGSQGGWQWQLRAQPLQLADLHPDARGALDADIAGTDAWPREGELHGHDLHFAELSLARADLRIQAESGARRHIEVRGEQIELAGVRLTRMTLAGDGDRERVQWRMAAQAEAGEAAAKGEWHHAQRALQVERLSLNSSDFGRWRLRRPSRFTFAPLRLPSQACLDAEHGAALCAGGVWRERLAVHAKGLDLGMLSAALAAQTPRFVLAGSLDANLEARYDDGNWRAALDARLGAGQLGLQPARGTPVFTWRQAHLHGERADERLHLTLDAATGSEGRVTAALDAGIAADAALRGFVELDLHQLAWLELLSPDLARPSGRVHGRLDIAGTRAAPAAHGEMLLSDFTAELPALGIALSKSQVRVQGADDGRFTLAARLHSGDGVLAIDGDGRAWPSPSLHLAVTGTRVRVVDNPELRALISPALSVQGTREQIAVRGVLELPEARIALDKLQPQASTHSPDVHVVDSGDADVAAGEAPLLLDLRLRPGAEVALKGFGLDGKLGGELQIRRTPGREALGVGSLTLSGQFQRYGKPLQIAHARLNYAGTPLTDPALDIRAERKLDGQMVGVQVSGRASRAQTELIAEPALAQSEILSYLVLGRPLRAASADEGARLDAAAMALGAGGNLLAGQLGARIGLDDAGVAESRILGANTLTVGKYLSPRLYLSYGVSLLGAGQVLSLKYLLGAGVDVELESGLESRASLNWRLER